MTDGWREAYRLQRSVYPELAYEATYGLRQGNLPVPKGEAPGARHALRRVLQSKLLISGLLAVIALATWGALSPLSRELLAPQLGPALFDTVVVSGLLLLEVSLLWWSGLQMVPTFLTSRIVPTLDTLPLPTPTVDRASLLLYLRLFDLPALTVLVATPIAVGAGLGSIAGGLLTLPAVASAVLFALGLSLSTGRFFLRHVQGAPGGSRRGTALRWLYLTLWAVPAFAMYGYIAIGPRLLSWLSVLSPTWGPLVLALLLASYPFGLAVWPILGAGLAFPSPFGSPLADALILLGSSAVYLLATAFVASWMLSAPRALTREVAEAPTPDRTPRTLAERSPALSVLVKDLRIASRMPGFAFLILLPILDAIAIGLFTVLGSTASSNVFRVATAAVATSALLATFFGPAFFAIEVIGASYTRTLPLSDRSVLLGKLGLVVGLYLVSAGTVLGLAMLRLFDPTPFLLFVGAELPAVAAASLLELGILVRVARRRGMPITNLYTGSWWVAAVGIPGIIVAGLPLIVFLTALPVGPWTGFPSMALVGVAELGLSGGAALLATGAA